MCLCYPVGMEVIRVEVLLSVLALLAVSALGLWLWCLMDPERLSLEYDRAMQRDLEYYLSHPDCTYEEAHMEREKVYRKHGL